jgi:peptide/nickel transport system substrate-binding protein
MQERDIRDLIEQVRSGGLPRRAFIHRMLAVGLTAPMASLLLTDAGVAQAQPALPPYKPTRRGGGGTLKILSWQPPVSLNPNLATSKTNFEAARIFYEPLAGWDAEGNLVPILSAEIPSLQNGGVAADRRSVTWTLKRGVTWHDGQPFTADDVVFNWEYCRHPETGASNVATYRDIRIEKVDAHRVRVLFPRPVPFWAEPLVGMLGMIIPKHVFAPYVGAKSRESPNNTRPVGTGPYRLVEFRPGDLIRAEANPNYHMPNRPHFDALEVKGGGEAATAARAVLQTGEYDYAGILQVEDDILRRLEDGGKGRVVLTAGATIEHILLNASDPWTEVDGERANAKSRHPAFQHKEVRDAMDLLVDRNAIQQVVFGRAAIATANFLNNPPQFRSPNMKSEFNIAKANQILDAAGWHRGADGIRAKGGIKLRFVFQAVVSAPRQKTQAIVKDACSKAGIELELKAVTAAAMFGGDPANPDNYSKFWSDMLLYAFPGTSPDPQFFMEQFCSWEVAQKANRWGSRNISRWRNEEYDRTHMAAQAEMDPARRAALFVRMNDIVCGEHHVIPLAWPLSVSGVSNRLVAPLSAWDLNFWALPHWYREA